MRRAAVLLLGVGLMLVWASPPVSAARAPVSDAIIVVLRDNVAEPGTVAREHARRHGGQTRFVFEHALKGYAADMPRQARPALDRDPRVAYIETDQALEAFGEVPTGVDRVEAERTGTARIDGIDERVDIDIAVLDSGIAAHPDLNVVGGARCAALVLGQFVSCTNGNFADGYGHGTHVAGSAAALDNGTGVVGVAPGARLWAVKVLRDSGSGLVSEAVAGIDWVTARVSTIEVANLSFGCQCTSQAMADALTRSTNAGVVYVVAAGNLAADAAGWSPANHPQVITVSAMADFDGRPGGGEPATCRPDVDDTLADFSNFGPAVDLAAPGVCITSTWKDGRYITMSGTSMAAPHATGAAALYIAQNGVPHGPARWSTVRDGLRSVWAVAPSSPCGFTGGKSGEPMLLLAACTS